MSAGNAGDGSGRLTQPGYDPFVLAVGADDTRGTDRPVRRHHPRLLQPRATASATPTSSRPGTPCRACACPARSIDAAYAATGAIDDRFFRGSGTSQAAAFVSGAAALLLEHAPTATPDQVKARSRRTAQPVGRRPAGAGRGPGQRGPSTWGLPAQPKVAQPFAPATGTGSLDASRGSEGLVLDGLELTGEQDIFGMPFDAAAHASRATAGTAWTGGSWNGSAWTGSAWSGTTWGSVGWTGRTWAGDLWSGRTWATGTWDGRTWAGTDWSGRTWAGRTWAGRTWADASWS